MKSANTHTPAQLSMLARALYTDGSWLKRTLQTHRPRICPFEVLISAVPEGASVLDAGCGSGLFLGLLARAGRITKGFGFDASAVTIVFANQMKARHPQGALLDFVHHDAGQPWPEGDFDVVSVIDLLHHVPRPQQKAVIHEAAKRVKPGGILLYKDMVTHPRWLAWVAVLHDLIFARQWVSIRPYPSIKSWIVAAGLVERQHTRITMYWYGHEMGVFVKPLLEETASREDD
jgi:2-polyprenyl-3-methyl-5-hydroxy-6-metoxy-1,4-benzoquinol methylase